MAGSGGSTGGTITLAELAALNAEVASLVRAGVPLERGLGELGGDLPGRLGRLTETIAGRLGAGRALGDVLADEDLPIPPLYRAVVQAGLRGGRLPAALESVARSARHLKSAQRMVASGLVYPMIVFLLAWALLLFFLIKVLPVLASTYEAFHLPVTGLLALLAAAGRSAVFWGPAVPVVVLAAVAVWWFRSRRASLVQPGFARPLLGWLPWMGPLLRASAAATFSEVLALLVENDVPLHEAVLLAAEAAGDPPILRSAEQIAAGLERGEVPSPGAADKSGFPPLLHWLVQTGGRRGALLPALRHAAEIYRRRATWYAETARAYLPILLTVVIGGSITLGYALVLLLPWLRFLYDLS